jgi:thymidine kinase
METRIFSPLFQNEAYVLTTNIIQGGGGVIKHMRQICSCWNKNSRANYETAESATSAVTEQLKIFIGIRENYLFRCSLVLRYKNVFSDTET